ncbi:hypothetical protein pb186bvf_013340 [Paramecium bursaria]
MNYQQLLKYTVFQDPSNTKQGNIKVQSTQLMKYKDEQFKSAPKLKTLDMRENFQIDTPITQQKKLSYSHSIQYIENFPDQQLDGRVLKLFKNTSSHLPQKQYKIRSTEKLQPQLQFHDNTYNVQLKFSNRAVKHQYQANLLYYKKTLDLPSQLNIVNHLLKEKLQSQQSKNQDPKSSTFRQAFLSTNRSQFYAKSSAQNKKSSSVNQETQINLEDVPTNVKFNRYNDRQKSDQ